MKYKRLIEHILGNAETYIEKYKDKNQLEEVEKGILLGLWMDIDSIKNQLTIEELEIDIDLDIIMNKLQELIHK